ncbi:tellurite resistance [Vibrio phage D518]
MFGKLFGKAKANVNAFTKRDLFEAAVAAGVLVAYADGDCSDNEIDTLENLLQNNPALANFKSEISKQIGNYCNQMEASARMGKRNLMKEIKDCEHNHEEAETILIVALDVADADDDTSADDAEGKVLKAIADELGLKVSDYE